MNCFFFFFKFYSKPFVALLNSRIDQPLTKRSGRMTTGCISGQLIARVYIFVQKYDFEFFNSIRFINVFSI